MSEDAGEKCSVGVVVAKAGARGELEEKRVDAMEDDEVK